MELYIVLDPASVPSKPYPRPLHVGMLFLCSYFCSTMEATIAVAKSAGSFKESILSINLSKVSIATQQQIHKDPGSGGCAHTHVARNQMRAMARG